MGLEPLNHAGYSRSSNGSVGDGHFPYPYSIVPLPPTVRHGIIPIGIVALLSVGSTLTLISFIVYRLFAWRSHYRTFIGYNQYVILVLNLLLADLQQSASFLVTFHWLRIDAILAPTPACFAQAWLLHSGDVSSAFFVLLIAVHTFYSAVYGRRISHRYFIFGIFTTWILAYFLTWIGVVLHNDSYFTRAGSWCWVSRKYETERLFCHYLWMFAVQFGTVVIYILTYILLRTKSKMLFKGYESRGQEPPNASTVKALKRIANLMALYPCIYLVLTLPLSAARMYELRNHRSVSVQFQCVAGALLCSCGWVDSLLYTLTRKRLLRDTMPQGASASSRKKSTGGATGIEELAAEPKHGISITQTQTVTIADQDDVDVPYEEWLRRPSDAPLMRGLPVITEGRSSWSEDSWRESSSPKDGSDPVFYGRGRYFGVKTSVCSRGRL